MPNSRFTSSTSAVASGPGELYSIICEGGATAGQVTIYDSTAQSGTILTAPPVPANSTVPISLKNAKYQNGLSFTISGGVTAVTLEWW